MSLIAVATCTDRKRFDVVRNLNAGQLPKSSQGELARVWRERLSNATPVGHARNVYCGRAFQEALRAAEIAGTELQIISGGLGLVRASKTIPSYSLSLVRQSAEYVGSRVSGEQFDPTLWWSQIQHMRAPLAALFRKHPNSTIAIAVSSSYLPLITSDLLALEGAELERLRLFGLGIDASCDERLKPCVVPYDARFDGPDSELPGTRGDFATRALRHFTEAIFPDTAKSLKAHCKAVDRYLSRWRIPPTIVRAQKTDKEIIEIIKTSLSATEGKSGRTLRYLRDVKKIACEQGRFRELFQRATK